MFKTQKSIILASVSIAVLILCGAIFGSSQFGGRQNSNPVQFSNSSSQSYSFQSNSLSSLNSSSSIKSDEKISSATTFSSLASSALTTISKPTASNFSSSTTISSSTSAGQTTEIKLYLADNNKINSDCGATSTVTRQIPQTEGLVKAALLELFKGETASEKDKGLSSSFKNWQEVLTSINLKADGTLQIDLKKEVLPQKQTDGSFTDKYNWGTFGTSCGSGKMQQIRQTAKQFPSVKYVIFSVNGQLQSPDNFMGCPENASGKPGNLENEKWEELKRQCGL